MPPKQHVLFVIDLQSIKVVGTFLVVLKEKPVSWSEVADLRLMDFPSLKDKSDDIEAEEGNHDG